MMLSKEKIDEILGAEYNRLCAEEGYTGGMGGLTWDHAAARAIEAAATLAALERAINIVNKDDLSKDGYSNATRSRIASKIRALIDQPAK